MDENIKYYVVKQKALPEVLLKVAQANRLIETKGISVADATEQVGISRSSYYKYKEDIFPFRDNVKGKTITFVLSMDDEPGLLSLVLKKVAEFHANILTIHQTIPVNGVASLTLSVDILPSTGDSSKMIEEIEQLPGAEDLTVGQQVYLSNQYGQHFPVKVTAKDESTITFDANHEMAGKELNFQIEIVEIL